MSDLPGRQPNVVVDVAGGNGGGAARWRAELDAHVSDNPLLVSLIGNGERLTPRWLIKRERMARSADIVVAPNNVSFALSGGERRVLLRNALHFLYRSEEHLLDSMPRAFRAQIPVVRGLLGRAQVIVVPCAAMADRVVHHVPTTAARLVVRPHPVTPAGPRMPGDRPIILVPVVPGPYKNLFAHLRLLVAAADTLRHPARVLVTADSCDLPPDLAANARVSAIGIVPHRKLQAFWQSAYAAFYPSTVESFGYPLAEARSYGVPVLAPQSAQAQEIAGPALRGYDPTDPPTLVDALAAADIPVSADATPFDRRAYFDWLLGELPAGSRRRPAPAQHRAFR